MKRKIKIKTIFAWYDLWIGIFIDRQKKAVYIFLLPCIGIKVESCERTTEVDGCQED